MKRVSDLSGAELDCWVAMAAGGESPRIGIGGVCVVAYGHTLHRFCPSTAWTHGGPIIERERIGVWPGTEEQPHHHVWTACIPSDDGTFDDLKECYGATPLEAAMRAFVASVYGEEVSDEGEW